MEDTVEDKVVENAVEDTVEDTVEDKVVEELKDGVKEVTKRLTDSDNNLSSDQDTVNENYDESASKEPMNPEDIASHEATAVSRDQDTGITEEGQAGTDSAETKEKFRKKGMTET
jgi:hypothetical protein